MKAEKKITGFTLVELLAVIAVIAILSGVLFPVVGRALRQSKIAASKAQLSNYVNAMHLFKSEYGYYPVVDGGGSSDSEEIDLSTESADFIKAMSGRDPESGDRLSPGEAGGNRRLISFYNFSELEFQLSSDGSTTVPDQLVDRFENPNIFIVVDTNGDGFVAPEGAEGFQSGSRIRTAVTAYVKNNGNSKYEAYSLWD